ncbi:hypothetical protein H5410_013842 [Solanum commersonii]|uniref:Uncharacterized protein n=1 Tax=Solanum commersonii TaxID=4109 RepID=A0A9J5ZPL5_SOLCO|nr:hypothetical protein H5410_013842 [Solanum commersonii]
MLIGASEANFSILELTKRSLKIATTFVDGSESSDYLWEEQALLNDSSELHLLDFSKLAVATDNFNGAGGFGPVYKGKLEDGQVIAVKRLFGQGIEEFKNI